MFSIRTVDTKSRFNWDNYQNKLSVKFGEELGSGCYGRAYAHPTRKNRAYKVAIVNRDKGYFTYIRELSKVVGDNPHLPNIYSATLYVFRDSNKEKMYVLLVEMERLESFLSVHKYADYNYNVCLGVGDRKKNMEKFCLNESARIMQFLSCDESSAHFYKDPQFVFARRFLEETSLRHDVNIDMHEGNVMLREDGTLVVIDPFVGHWDDPQKEIRA